VAELLPDCPRPKKYFILLSRVETMEHPRRGRGSSEAAAPPPNHPKSEI